MADFSPRQGKSDYIRPRGKHFYYRRVIPSKLRHFFGGKTEWNIRLEAATAAGRKAEAGALAHEHNMMMVTDLEAVATAITNSVDGTVNLKLDFSPDKLPVNVRIPPFEFYRDGKLIETYKIAGSTDPDFLREAEEQGFFVLSGPEWAKQAKLMKLRQSARTAANPDAKQLAKLRINNAKRDIDELPPATHDTLRSILPKLHQHKQQRSTTRAGHHRAVEEFISLHGNLPLSSITKRHVADYVAHLGTVSVKGRPLAPTTVRQRLEKLVSILQFAAYEGVVEYNVGRDVRAPKDVRPMGDQVCKPFTKLEVRNLIEAGTSVWSNRRYQTHKTKLSRKTDFITALHMLVWTGARPEEICQLRIEDVDLVSMGIEITNVSDDLDARKRLLKNEESVRGVPIHKTLLPRLIDHIEYVRSVSNSGLLFPSFKPESETGRYARPISNEWTDTLREHVSDDPQKVLYSLRHSWAGESVEVGMSEDMRNAIMGHVSGSKSPSAKRYRQHFDDLENQLEWVNKMDCLNDRPGHHRSRS
jgi:integrase